MKRIPCILLLFAFMMAGTSSLFAQTALEGERSTYAVPMIIGEIRRYLRDGG